jgi:hypothetical protein
MRQVWIDDEGNVKGLLTLMGPRRSPAARGLATVGPTHAGSVPVALAHCRPRRPERFKVAALPSPPPSGSVPRPVARRRDGLCQLPVATFGAAAAACEKYLAKGRQIAVTGRLIYREWQAPDGSRRSKHAASDRSASAAAPNGQPIEADHPTDSADNGDEDIDF